MIFFRQVIQTCLSLLVLIVVTFVLLQLTPGGPFDQQQQLPVDVQKKLNQRYGLDRPVAVQLLIYLKRVAAFDFGTSLRTPDEPVIDIFSRTLPVSLELAGWAFFSGLLLSVLMVLFLYHWPRWRTGFVFVSTVLTGVPVYLLAALAVFVFAMNLEILPVAFWDGWQHRILPVLCLALPFASEFARLLQQEIEIETGSDYVRQAMAKGASDTHVFYWHVMPNALPVTIAVLGPSLANLVMGSFAIEYVFALPGVGRFFVESMLHRDYPAILALTLVYGLVLLTANMAFDLLQAWLDPRQRSQP